MKLSSLSSIAFAALLFSTACTKLAEKDLPETKASSASHQVSAPPHHIFVGFLVSDGADPAASTNPANSPDSVDFLEFFAGRDPVRADWRTAQAKGTRIVVCHFLGDAYFDGSVKDPSTPPGQGQSGSTATSSYNDWARAMFAQHITADSLDGIDLDIESGTFGGDVQQNNLDSLVTAVARYFGPNSAHGNTVMGKKPVFFYDTDGTVSDNSTYSSNKSNVDYVLFQAYTNPGQGWGGSGTADFPPLINRYGSDKLIYLVDGDIFTADESDIASHDLITYANYIQANNGVGVGAYRMSRAFSQTPPFDVPRRAIQIMNPSAAAGIVSGATYKIFTAVNNSSVLDVTGGATANFTKVELWTNNSPTTTNQEWVVTSLGSGYYKLQPLNAPGKCLDVNGAGTANGTQVQIYSDNSTAAQKWLFTSNGNSYYSLSPACAPGSSLDDNAQITTPGNKIQIWQTNQTSAQSWQFVKQ